MNKSLTLLTAVLSALLCLSACHSSKSALAPARGMSSELPVGSGTHPLDEKQAAKWLSSLAGSYTAWQKMSLSGSLNVKKLPIDPSVKIYMERGSLVIISLRVPLLGEVGRMELDSREALVINRRGKCYTRMSTASLLNRVGVNLTDFQDLLLGRVFLAGSAPLSKDNVELFTLSETPGGAYMVAPRKQRDDAEYGFTLHPDGKMMLAVAFTTDEAYLLQNEYTHSGTDTSVTMSITAGRKNYTGTLTYEAPNLKPKPIERITLDSKWKEVSLKALVASF